MVRKTKYDDKSRKQLIEIVTDKFGVSKKNVTKLSYDELIALLTGKKSRSKSVKKTKKSRSKSVKKTKKSTKGKFPSKLTRKPKSKKIAKKKVSKPKKNIKKKKMCCKYELMIELMKNTDISLNKVLQMKVTDMRKKLKEYMENVFEQDKLTSEEELSMDEESLDDKSEDESEDDSTDDESEEDSTEDLSEDDSTEDENDLNNEENEDSDESDEDENRKTDKDTIEIDKDISPEELSTDEEQDKEKKDLNYSLEKADEILGKDMWSSIQNTNEDTKDKFKTLLKTKVTKNQLVNLLKDFGIEVEVEKSSSFEKSGYPLNLSKNKDELFLEYEDNKKSQYFEIPITSKNKDNKYITIFN
jgi:hypothetical protein